MRRGKRIQSEPLQPGLEKIFHLLRLGGALHHDLEEQPRGGEILPQQGEVVMGELAPDQKPFPPFLDPFQVGNHLGDGDLTRILVDLQTLQGLDRADAVDQEER